MLDQVERESHPPCHRTCGGRRLHESRAPLPLPTSNKSSTADGCAIRRVAPASVNLADRHVQPRVAQPVARLVPPVRAGEVRLELGPVAHHLAPLLESLPLLQPRGGGRA
eukprot:4605318-Prymnesium_polylepis.1